MPTAIVGIIVTAISSVMRGSQGLVGALLGAVIVVGFFTFGQVILWRVIQTNPAMAMTVALTVYLVKIGVLFGLLLAFKGTNLFDTKVFATSVLACTIAWTMAEVWTFSTSKVLYVEPGSGPDVVPPDSRPPYGGF